MMVAACVYKVATGEIRRTVYCPEEMAALQAGPGEAVVLGEATDATHCVVAGALVAYSEAERARKAARPQGVAAWSNATRDWLDLRTLEQRRADKWAELKVARAAAIVAPLVVDGIGTFDADPDSQTNIIRTAQMMQTEAATLQPGETPEDDFTLYDNTVVRVTAAQMVAAALTLGARTKAIFATGRALRMAIDVATTPEAVEAVAWPD